MWGLGFAEPPPENVKTTAGMYLFRDKSAQCILIHCNGKQGGACEITGMMLWEGIMQHGG